MGILYTLDHIPPVSYNPGDDIVRDGQRFLLQQILPAHELRWQVLPRSKPAHWFDRRGRLWSWVKRRHPKAVWPLWSLVPACNANRLCECDILLNASGPLLYFGNRYHSRYEPWSLLLVRALRQAPRVRFLNLGLGTCFPVRGVLAGVGRLLTPLHRAFCRQMHAVSSVVVCRERTAYQLFEGMHLSAYLLPCPSLFAADYWKVSPARGRPDYIAVNFHPAGTRTSGGRTGYDPVWAQALQEILNTLGRRYRLKLVFHESLEMSLATRCLDIGRWEVVVPSSLREFLAIYGSSLVAFTARVHGTYAAASLGVPSLTIGSDSRLTMIDLLGLPHLFWRDASPARIVRIVDQLVAEAEGWRRRLQELKERTLYQYVTVLRRVLDIQCWRESALHG